MVLKLLSGTFDRLNVHAAALAVKKYRALHQCEQGKVAAHADVLAWVPFRTALPGQDIPGDDSFSAELLDAATLGV
jgi:hypothetical protein